MQQLTRKIAFANLQTTNWLLSQPPGTDTKQPLTESVDAIAMLGHLNTQLSQFRREQIRPALKPEYKAICSAEIHADSQEGNHSHKARRPKRNPNRIKRHTQFSKYVHIIFA